MNRLFAVIAAAALLLAGCSDANVSQDPSSVTQGVDCEYPTSGEPAKIADPPKSTGVSNEGTVTATMRLSGGEVEMTLDRAAAPCTVNSFVSLVEQGYFDNTSCHRLVDYGIFVLQCGDPSGTGRGGPGYTIPDELSDKERYPDEDVITYPRGTLAMAKTADPNSGGSQFFIVWNDSPLPPEYTMFGTVNDAGLDVVGQIAAQGVDASDGTSPIAPADIETITLG